MISPIKRRTFLETIRGATERFIMEEVNRINNPPDLLLSDVKYNPSLGLYLPPRRQTVEGVLEAMVFPFRTYSATIEEPEFVVDMVEPLVGWRAWNYSNGHLVSINSFHQWPYETPMRAKCIADNGKATHESPRFNCTCGVYALDAVVEETDCIFGQVYGWGRYVRGDNGWRAQFAYPVNLYVPFELRGVVSKLKNYRVPIFLLQSVKVYDPVEDGYEHREAEAYGHLGADQESDAAED